MKLLTGEPITVALEDAPAELLGTLGVRLENEAGVVVEARTTDLVLLDGVFTFTFPEQEPGVFYAVWDDPSGDGEAVDRIEVVARPETSSGRPLTADDARRSIRRLLAGVLPAPWTVATEEEQASERPFVEVLQPGDASPRGVQRISVPAGDTRWGAGFAITAYPLAAATAPEARRGAEEMLGLILDTLTIGVVEGTTGESISGPLSVPLYDFAGVPVVGPGRGGGLLTGEVLSLVNPAGRVIADPEDDLVYTAVVTFRGEWWRGGRALPPGFPLLRTGGRWIG